MLHDWRTGRDHGARAMNSTTAHMLRSLKERRSWCDQLRPGARAGITARAGTMCSTNGVRAAHAEKENVGSGVTNSIPVARAKITAGAGDVLQHWRTCCERCRSSVTSAAVTARAGVLEPTPGTRAGSLHEPTQSATGADAAKRQGLMRCRKPLAQALRTARAGAANAAGTEAKCKTSCSTANSLAIPTSSSKPGQGRACPCEQRPPSRAER